MWPPYVVLFKIFFWDDGVDRRLAELRARVRDGELWVVVDDSHGYVEGVQHERVFRTIEADFRRLGLAAQPEGQVNWYNVDYQLLAFYDVYPNYDYYVMVEYDVAVQRDIDALMEEIASERLDFVAKEIRLPIDAWGWTSTLDALWPHERIEKYLLTVAVFSRPAVEILLCQRRSHAERFGRGEIKVWPFCEGAVPSILRDAGFRLETLERFGPTVCMDWWPPYHESELPALSHEPFVHPVHTGERYVKSALRHPSPEAWFDPNSLLRHKLDLEVPELVVPTLVERLTAKNDIARLTVLRDVIDDFGWKNCRFDLDHLLRPLVMRGRIENLALGRPAYQSSVSPWSHAPGAAEDAGHGADGTISGKFGFHTAFELRPWWVVDLVRLCLVSEIRLFNRLDVESARANYLSIWASTNARTWRLIQRHSDNVPFGGADGKPLIASCGDGKVARFVRVELDRPDYLHLDEVEVWGVPFPR